MQFNDFWRTVCSRLAHDDDNDTTIEYGLNPVVIRDLWMAGLSVDKVVEIVKLQNRKLRERNKS